MEIEQQTQQFPPHDFFVGEQRNLSEWDANVESFASQTQACENEEFNGNSRRNLRIAHCSPEDRMPRLVRYP
jgi:hypothetical protein